MTETLSKETRWFLSNEQVQPIKDWFLGLSQPKHFNVDEIYPRQDYYLIMPRVENLSIKIREPKKDPATGKIKTALEVKRRVSENEPIELSNNNNGYLNKWQKLSYELTEKGDDLLSINPLLSFSGDNWLRIDKDRILAKYDAEHNSIAEEDGYPDEVCGIELTKVKLNNSVYYSFGLEAFSKSGNKIESNFAECCNYIFDHINVTGLALGSSLSYPEFLATII